MEHLTLKYQLLDREFVNAKILAVIKNTLSKEDYLISSYRSLERAKELAPRAYKVMLKYPSKQFKTFINKKER